MTMKVDKTNWPKDNSLGVQTRNDLVTVVKYHHMTTVVHTEPIAYVNKEEAIQLALLLIKAGQQ